MTRGTVLVTRPEPGAAATASALRASGWQPVVAPFLTVRPMHTPLPGPRAVQAVVAASGNALDLPRHHGLLLLAVGDATAARARKAGFTRVHSAGGDARDLAALATRLLDPAAGPLLLATGRGQGTGLARALRGAGFAVRRRAVYAAGPVRRFPPAAAAALAGGARATLFFSTDTAGAFARLLPPALRARLPATDAAAISMGVANAVRHLPWRSLHVALRPTQDEVLALL